MLVIVVLVFVVILVVYSCMKVAKEADKKVNNKEYE